MVAKNQNGTAVAGNMVARVRISPTERVLFKYFKAKVRGLIRGTPVTLIRPVHPLAADQHSRTASLDLCSSTLKGAVHI